LRKVRERTTERTTFSCSYPFLHTFSQNLEGQSDLIGGLRQSQPSPDAIPHPIEADHPLPLLLLREDGPLKRGQLHWAGARGEGSRKEGRGRKGKEDVGCLGQKRNRKYAVSKRVELEEGLSWKEHVRRVELV
jgi:hypothetical protein